MRLNTALNRVMAEPKTRADFESRGATVVTGTPEQCIERVRKSVAMGITSFVISFGRNPKVETLELFAERVMPAFR